MEHISKALEKANLPQSPGNTPGSELSATSTLKTINEPYGVEKNIQSIMLRRGVPELFLSSDYGVFPKGIISQIGAAPGSYFITGPVGTWKTRLACAIMRDSIITMSKGAYIIDTCVRGIFDARFVPVTSLLVRIKAAFEKNAVETEAEIISRISDMALLVLDDLGSEKASEWVLSTIYTILDIRHREAKPVIITSNLSLDAIAEALSDRISSRIAGMCKVITMSGKDRRLHK